MKKIGKPAEAKPRQSTQSKLVRYSKKTITASVVGADFQKLVHKLEAQNKELKQARTDAEESYRQYTDLYDFAPVGYLTLAVDASIRRVNQAGANLIGVERHSLVNQWLGMFVSNASLPTFSTFLEKLSLGQGKETCELELLNGGRSIWVRIEATCFEGGGESRAVIVDISERRQMEQALRESENRFRSTLQDIQNIAVQGYAPDGTVQYWNSASERFYDYSAQEALGRNLLDLIIPPEMRDEVRRDVQKMVETGHPIPASELSLMRKDGSRISVYSSHTIVSCPGCVPELFCLDVDLTERKRTEELFRESEWRNRIVSELTTDYIFVVDVNPNGMLKFRWASDNLFRITGRKVEEVETSDLWGDIIHPDDRERFFGFITQILSTAEAGSLECRTFYKQGEERWICVFAHPQTGSEGGVTTIVGAIQDITERKRVEEKLAYQANLLANVNDAIIASDAEYRLTAWNSAAEALYGWKAEEVLGRNGLEIIQTQWSQEDAESVRRTIAETGRWRGEATQVRKDGIRIPVEISSLTLRDANGRTEGYISVNRDITERKQAEDELRRARESLMAMNLELETALAREKQLAHTDPLTGINNRRRLYELVEHEIEIAARYRQPLSVMMFDIDHFKKVNDTFGHEVGDHILQRVTQVACGELRSADVIGRYGGEEFVVALPMTKAQQAYPLAERIRLAVAALCVPTENGDVSVTLSIGIVEMRHGPKNDSSEDMIRRADKAMYAAKQSGRNLTLIGDA